MVGEACAAIYAPTKIHPNNIEFVIQRTTIPKLKSALSTVGFRSSQMRRFKNKKCPFVIVILPPPLAVGDELVKDTVEIKVGTRSFKTLSVTDCIRYKLASYYRWADETAYEHALHVAKGRRKYDMTTIQRWSEWEWADDKFAEFMKRVHERRGEK